MTAQTGTAPNVLSIPSDREKVWGMWAAYNIAGKEAVNRQQRDDDSLLPAVERVRSFRLLMLSMLLTGSEFKISKSCCRQAAILRDGELFESDAFEQAWRDICELVGLFQGPDRAKFGELLTRWANS